MALVGGTVIIYKLTLPSNNQADHPNLTNFTHFTMSLPEVFDEIIDDPLVVLVRINDFTVQRIFRIVKASWKS
ncbi:hypothetical protein V6N12_018874 [Hibiscus sabdariffa]|uniref:Uncharacterized protein n=1 Tax=Hibiscus sabdariffa TaxID=183260 RepID=A0ABR2ATH9_9ROSI